MALFSVAPPCIVVVQALAETGKSCGLLYSRTIFWNFFVVFQEFEDHFSYLLAEYSHNTPFWHLGHQGL